VSLTDPMSLMIAQTAGKDTEETGHEGRAVAGE
jgi:hypothetical protein